jgi:2-acylglycerol O-acyltransferase 2
MYFHARFRDFIPQNCVFTMQDPNRSYLFGSHPHGLLCSGAFGAFATDALNFTQMFPGLTPRQAHSFKKSFLLSEAQS